MTLHFKDGGEWLTVNRPYLKVDGVWTPMTGVYVKDAGTWEQSYVYDVTPPDPPTLSLEIIETSYTGTAGAQRTGRYIKVGVRSPGVGHDPNLKRIRVLTTYNGKSPTTYNGGTYTSAPDEDWPNEPWSDYHFNGFGSSSLTKDSSVTRYKQWTRNPTNSTNLAEGRYYFAAWSEDLNGNWSNGVFSYIDLPRKGVDGSDAISKEARFQPGSTGSYKAGSFVYGDPVQQDNPRSRGLFFYGTQLKDSIGKQGAVTIKNAQLYVHRRNDDGAANANLYLFWHDYKTKDDIGSEGVVKHEVTKIGQIAKGESKWFDLPSSFTADLANNNIRGFGFDYKDPVKAAASANDYSVLKKASDAPRSGELHVVWTEKP